MPVWNPQQERFRKSLPGQLDAFMEKRRAEIGDPAEWRLTAPTLGVDYPQMRFNHARKPGMITFALTNVPDLSPEQSYAIREQVCQLCVDRGFQTPNPRIRALPKQVIDGVKRGDRESWNTFVGKHQEKFTKHTEHLLRGVKSPTLLEADDLVSESLESVYKRCVNNEVPPQNVHSLIFMDLFSKVGQIPRRSMRRQAGEADFDQLAAPEYDGQVEKLSEQLTTIIGEAKNRLSPRQEEVLETIEANYKAAEPLKLPEVAKNLGMTHQRLHQHLQRIAKHIKEVASQPGFEETASLIRSRFNRSNHDAWSVG